MKSRMLSALGRRTGPPPISWLMRLTLERPRVLSLAAGFTDSDSLPVTEARELLEGLLRRPRTGRACLQYGTTLGDDRLRQLTAQRLQQLDGARAGEERYSPARLIITGGSQQLLYMVTEALCDPGDIVLVEDPTYFVFLGMMQSHGLQGRGLRMDAEGLQLGHLDQTLASLKRRGQLGRVKLLYLVSYYQNPTGACTSLARKAGALELLRHYERAAGHPIFLLEDAAYRELGFAGDRIESALSAGRRAERVIYMGTYSKPFATGVRVGFGVLPEPVFTAVERIKGNHDFGTSNLLQQLLARALETGLYENHLSVLRARYARKAAVMSAAMRRHFPEEVRWQDPRGGLYIWARVSRQIKTGTQSRCFQSALKREVLYVPGGLCYAEDPTRPKPDHELRLSFGGAGLAAIREGIARLGQTLAERMKDKRGATTGRGPGQPSTWPRQGEPCRAAG
jgi:2-aminoadipate transaminase